MKVKCTCGKEYDVHEKLIGKAVRCQKCARSFVVPVPKEPPRQATLQMTTATSAPMRVTQPQSPQPNPAAGPQATQWVAGPVPNADPKERAEREQEILSQYVPYKPKPGEKLHGKALAQANLRASRGGRMSVAWRWIGGGVLWLVIGAVAFFQLELEDSGAAEPGRRRGIVGLLYMIGGKWTVVIGLAVIALVFISYGILYWRGVVGKKDNA